MGFESTELMEWLEDAVRHIMEKDTDGVAIVGQSTDGETFTAYFKCGQCRKIEFASHIQADAIYEIAKDRSEEEDDE